MRRPLFTTIGLIAAAIAIAGCSATPTPKIDYTPGELSGTDQNFAANLAGCMKDAGWDVEVHADNSMSAEYPDEQDDAYTAALDSCKAEFGYDVPPPELTTEQLKTLYQANMALAGCLREQGHQINDIPSEQAFIDGSGVFDPYGELQNPGGSALTEDEYAKLIKICPEP